jgi:hypothetical protein
MIKVRLLKRITLEIDHHDTPKTMLQKIKLLQPSLINDEKHYMIWYRNITGGGEVMIDPEDDPHKSGWASFTKYGISQSSVVFDLSLADDFGKESD